MSKRKRTPEPKGCRGFSVEWSWERLHGSRKTFLGGKHEREKNYRSGHPAFRWPGIGAVFSKKRPSPGGPCSLGGDHEPHRGSLCPDGHAWETKDAPGSENGERPGGTESSTAVTKVWYGTGERGFWYRMELFQKEEDGSLTLLHITEEDAGGRTMQLAGYPDKSPMEPSVKEGETLSLKTLLGGLWTEPAETKVQKVEKYQEDHGFRYVIRHKVLQSVFPGTEGKELTGTINRTDTVRTGPDETVKEFVIQADSVYDVYEEMGAVVEYRIEFFSGDEAGNMELGSGTGPSE